MPKIVAKLEILLDEDGQVTCNGPIDNRLLCYGLLTVAHDSIQEHNFRKQNTRRIELVTDEEREAIGMRALKLDVVGGKPRE